MEPAEKLTAKQIAFCKAYSVKRSGTKAAIEAGYSEKTAASIAYQQLQLPEIKQYIKFLEEEKLAEADISKADLLLELKKIAFANYTDYATYSEDTGFRVNDFEGLTRDQLAAVSEVSETTGKYGTTTKLKLHSKLDAIGKLAELLGHKAPEKKEVTVTEGNLEKTAYSLKKRAKKDE